MTTKRKRHSGERYIRIFASLFDSPAFRTLPPNALKLWIDLRRAYYGSNNGNISCTLAELRRYGWCSSGTLNRALWQLLERGLIKRTRDGKPGPLRLCSLYAFTDIPTARNDRLEISAGPPTNEFIRWVPDVSFAPSTKAGKLAANAGKKKTPLQKSEQYRSETCSVTAPQNGETRSSPVSKIGPAVALLTLPEAAPSGHSSRIAH